jgi:hypothetical protein
MIYAVNYKFHKEREEKNNPNKAIIIVLDNLRSHKVISTTFVRHIDDMRNTIYKGGFLLAYQKDWLRCRLA